MEKEKAVEMEHESIWFKEHEQELMEKAKERKRMEEAIALKKSHYMHCPKCGHLLHEIMLEDVTVDKCEGCEGVWLDRGELNQFLVHSEEKKANFFKRLFSR
jgi:ribosomal protein L37AE/L43A